jgi:flagellar hook-length control protein FliK
MPIPAGETPAVPAAAKPTAAPAQTETKTAMLVQEAAAVEGEAVVETEFALPAADASADTVMAPPAPAEPKPAAQSDSITPDAAVISMAAPMVVAPALPRMLGQQPSAPQTAADVPALEVLGDPELRPLAKADGTAHAIADDTSDEPDSSVASTPAGAKTTEASAAAPAQQTARSAVTAFADLLAAGLTDAAPASSTTTASTFALMPAEAVAPGAGVVSSANPVAAAHASAQLLRGQTVPSMEAARAVGLQISKAMQAGDTAFSIRLDPPELGRVDIKLDVASDGRVQALVAADSPQVLDLLRRESMILERALTDAGLRTDQGALQFSLRQNSDQASGEAGRQTAQHESDGGAGAGAASTSDVTHLPAYRWLPAGSSLQVFA